MRSPANRAVPSHGDCQPERGSSRAAWKLGSLFADRIGFELYPEPMGSSIFRIEVEQCRGLAHQKPRRQAKTRPVPREELHRLRPLLGKAGSLSLCSPLGTESCAADTEYIFEAMFSHVCDADRTTSAHRREPTPLKERRVARPPRHCVPLSSGFAC
jgi:hypothetical protein